jgi:transcriptional regulator
MYLPPAFRNEDVQAQHELIRGHPLATVISAGPGGLLANPIPCLIYAEGDLGTLRLHMARANPQIAELQRVDECLVVFQGPHSYVTPAWYATKRETGKVVPTWNYLTVHVWGRPRVIEDAAWLRRQVSDLTDFQEHGRLEPWAVTDAPEDYIAAQLKGITGVEIPIVRMEGKWKLSQNRSAEDRRGVAEGLLAEHQANARIGELVEREASRGKPAT